MGVQAVLMSNPPQPGKTYKAKFYQTSLKKVVEVEIEADQPEMTKLLDGSSPELIPVTISMTVDEQNGVRSRSWLNEKGEIQKTVTLSGKPTSTFRVGRDVVQRIQDGYHIDELTTFSMPLSGELPESELNEILYKVDGTGIDPYTVFPTTSNQSLQSVSARSAAVTVSRITADAMSADTPPEDMTPYLGSTSLIQADSEAITELAKDWLADEQDKAKQAAKLTKAVQANLERVEEFSSTFESAREVVRSMKGDSTEHAVLLTALLRNQKIPARCVVGLLVNSTARDQLDLHMWTEAWIDDHWLPLDATAANTISPYHIKLSDTALEGENPYATLIPAIELLGKLQIGVSSFKE